MCFTCGQTLRWTELVPLGSFLTQGGKCSHCRTPISWQYPLVEALTGTLFVFLYFHFSFLILISTDFFSTILVLFAYYGFVFCLLIVLSVYDLKHKILPDRLNALFGMVAFVGMFLIDGYRIVFHLPSLWQILAGIILPFPFVCIWMLSKGRWMGLGDPKLMIGIGFLLGLSSGITAILLSFWIGALVSILLLVGSSVFKKSRFSLQTAIPFGPFLALATLIVFLCDLDFMSITHFIGTIL